MNQPLTLPRCRTQPASSRNWRVYSRTSSGRPFQANPPLRKEPESGTEGGEVLVPRPLRSVAPHQAIPLVEWGDNVTRAVRHQQLVARAVRRMGEPRLKTKRRRALETRPLPPTIALPAHQGSPARDNSDRFVLSAAKERAVARWVMIAISPPGSGSGSGSPRAAEANPGGPTGPSSRRSCRRRAGKATYP
jgi:hypothetical protein